jgi:hypothetical protein
MRRLTEFERRLVSAVISQHQPFAALGDDLDSLKVENTRNTGVGAYITFSENDQEAPVDVGSAQLGFDGSIYVPGVPSGLGCVIDVDSGKLNHIELFTYGDEAWDGATDGAKVIPRGIKGQE